MGMQDVTNNDGDIISTTRGTNPAQSNHSSITGYVEHSQNRVLFTEMPGVHENVGSLSPKDEFRFPKFLDFSSLIARNLSQNFGL